MYSFIRHELSSVGDVFLCLMQCSSVHPEELFSVCIVRPFLGIQVLIQRISHALKTLSLKKLSVVIQKFWISVSIFVTISASVFPFTESRVHAYLWITKCETSFPSVKRNDDKRTDVSNGFHDHPAFCHWEIIKNPLIFGAYGQPIQIVLLQIYSSGL